MKATNPPIRINKYLAQKNMATRKGADTLIEKGLVTVNGKRAVLGMMVGDKDIVIVKGKAPKYLYYAYNKTRGIVTSTPQGDEKDILHVASFPKGVFPIGRLDKDSEGLIIMTNDGRLTDKLLNPNNDHEKEYRVEVDRPFPESFLTKMSRGVKIDSYITKPATLKRIGTKIFTIVLTEGKNRQIRRMCEALGFTVKRLTRIRVMNITLGSIKAGTSRQIEGEELKKLLSLLRL